MEKYYTPESSEFRIGFEYELNLRYPNKPGIPDDWIEAHITEDNWYANMDTVNNLQRTRVKYLDREDVESLGWRDVEQEYPPFLDNQETNEFIKGLKFQNLKSPHITLTFFGGKEVANIYSLAKNPKTGEYNAPLNLFMGNVKNKSELQILMKQLGIA